ncbi:MAG TPA: hypothetical protein VKT30_06585, partial [Caulobacteraceae bacterium]|nr:hypothetical protein [Caulobacteraceae bacterium]
MRKLLAAASALAVFTASASPAGACGPPPTGPSFVDVFGGPTPDLNAFYDGRIGVVMAQSPRGRLYMDWRLLHGQPVGRQAGPGLSIPCCGNTDPDTWDATSAWLQARAQVVGGAPTDTTITTDIPLPDGGERPNCFADAFHTATATLNARIAAYG